MKIETEILPLIVNDDDKLKIVQLIEFVLRTCNGQEYDQAELERIINIAREGFQFRPAVTNIIIRYQRKL